MGEREALEVGSGGQALSTDDVLRQGLGKDVVLLFVCLFLDFVLYFSETGFSV